MREMGMPRPEDMNWKPRSETVEHKLEQQEKQDFSGTDPIREHIERLRMQRPDLSERDFSKIEKQLRKESSSYQKKDEKLTNSLKLWLSEKKARLASIFGIVGAVTSIGLGVSHASGEPERKQATFDVGASPTPSEYHSSSTNIVRVGDVHAQPSVSHEEPVSRVDTRSAAEKKEALEVEALADEVRGLLGNEVVDTIMSLETIKHNTHEKMPEITVSGFENCPAFMSNEPMKKIVDVMRKHLASDIRNVVYEQRHRLPPASYGIEDPSNEVIAYTEGDTITFYQGIDGMDLTTIQSFFIHEFGHKVAEPEWDTHATVKQRLEAAKAKAHYIIKSEPTARLLPPDADPTPTPELPLDPSEKFHISDYDEEIHNDIPHVELVLRMKELTPELFRKLVSDELPMDSPEEKIILGALKISNPNLNIDNLRADLINVDIQNEKFLEALKKTKTEKVANAEN